jgi:iron complex transport system ATP-binding protein
MTRLSARAIRHAFQGREVLAGVDFELSGGEIVGLIGPNGAGKTTLLRVLAGLIEADEGEVSVDGTAIADLAPDARGRAISYLAQAGTSEWAVTVETLVGLGRIPHLGRFRGPGPADRDAVRRALGACDVAVLADRPVNRLSGGERARVMLARALAVEAPFLLADEPVAGLDPAHALDVMAVLAARARAGAGIVVVVHDLTIAARHCDRLVLMQEGRIVAEGSPEAVLNQSNLANVYGIHALTGTAKGGAYVVPLSRARGE